MHFTLPKDGGLIESSVPKAILHSYEKTPVEIFPSLDIASAKIAELVIERIKNAAEGRLFKLGLSTGSSPKVLYKLLSEACQRGEVSFRNVEIYTIDEFYPLDPDMAKSRNYIIHSLLLNNIDIDRKNIHTPDSTIPQDEIAAYCEAFEQKAKDMDLLVLGIGEHGQVGFNEVGTMPQSPTRMVLLPYKSRKRQSKAFGRKISDTPSMALTMGIQTMMSAKEVVLMAFGEEKADAIINSCEAEISAAYPASYFQRHNNAVCYVDENAASGLTRIVAPWLIGPCEWTAKFRRKAVVWLCRQVGKPILKLSQNDYLEHNLGEMLDKCGDYAKINIDIFNDLQHTISGWPGGKPGCEDKTRPVEATPWPKTVLIFSPHPDDDVISMGGTFIRLAHQGHNVHVAYQTSGDVAVHDDVVVQHMDAAAELGFGNRVEEIKKLIAGKVIGEAEPRELLEIKAAIRRSEAKGSVRSFGLDESHAHFLNLPFYESGGIAKLPRTQVDVDIIKELMDELKPDQIYMAGDLADPHGTHRVCTEAALEAFEQLRDEGAEWTSGCHIWLYRGAWMEWEIGSVDMAVPLSPEEVVEKRYAIYHHLSQKDIVPFPGDDPREFWQRAEDRTGNTARIYNELGMAEYQAMEVFLKLC